MAAAASRELASADRRRHGLSSHEVMRAAAVLHAHTVEGLW